MSPVEIIILVLLLAIVVFLVAKKPSASFDHSSFQQTLSELRKELQETTNNQRREVADRLDQMSDRMMKNLTESSSTLQKNFQNTSGIIRDVTEKLTKLDETNKQVLGFSTQLQSLENILKNPKHRGILGEYWLESLLGQVLAPGQYEMQYDLGIDETSGQKLIPDAVIHIKEMLIPIDSKFSLENYNKISNEQDVELREQLGKNLETTVRAFNASSGELKKVDKDVFRITQGAAGKLLEPIEIEQGSQMLDD